MSRHKGLAAVLCWLPVAGIIVALFVAPSSTGAVSIASLNVTPGSGVYGGQQLTFSGVVGPGGQAIWLQRRGDSGAAWADVPDSIPKPWTTGSDGRFRFTFHAPAMNAVQFRVVSRTAATPAHTFSAEHQEADLLVRELQPPFVVWPTQKVFEPLPPGFAVRDEPYELRVDTVNRASGDKKPVLPGRAVALQRRQADNSWQHQLGGLLDGAGFADFDGATIPGEGVYRAVLGDWKENGDDVGWFPSLPFYLRIVTRPLEVTDLGAVPTSSSVTLTWKLPRDSNRYRIVVVRGGGGDYVPTWAAPARYVIKTIAATETSFVDTAAIEPNRAYSYAVYTVSKDGVYSRVAARTEVRTLDAQRGAL